MVRIEGFGVQVVQAVVRNLGFRTLGSEIQGSGPIIRDCDLYP